MCLTYNLLLSVTSFTIKLICELNCMFFSTCHGSLLGPQYTISKKENHLNWKNLQQTLFWPAGWLDFP